MLIWPCVVGCELPGKRGVEHVRALRVSFVLSFKYLRSTCQGRSEQERLVSCLELSHQLCFTIFLFSSIWVQNYAQGRSNCFSFTQYRGIGGNNCQPLGLLLLSLLWNFIDAWGEKKICSNPFLLNWLRWFSPSLLLSGSHAHVGRLWNPGCADRCHRFPECLEIIWKKIAHGCMHVCLFLVFGRLL